MSYKQITQHSSHLFISDAITAQNVAIAALQHALCEQATTCNNSCKNCMLIEQKNHPWVAWLSPENSYNVGQIDEVIGSSQFLLDAQEKRFFIFTEAHELTSACSNRLLKTIEEPHSGYYFIFITHRPQELLPTLISRCFVQQIQSKNNMHLFHDILQPFIDFTLDKPAQFMKILEKQNIKESATKEIIDQLFQHFHQKLKESIEKNNEKEQKTYLNIIVILQQSLQQLPVQGSYKLFWKNFYLTFHQQLL